MGKSQNAMAKIRQNQTRQDKTRENRRRQDKLVQTKTKRTDETTLDKRDKTITRQ